MSEQSEFEKWLKTQHPDLIVLYKKRDESFFNAGYQACTDRKDEELAALRNLLKEVVDCELINDDGLYSLGLIDQNGNPTKLLTGEGE